MQRFGTLRPEQAGSYAALVDILLATMGIFVVVFTQLHLNDAPRLQPAPVDGLIVCSDPAQLTLHHHADGSFVTQDATIVTVVAAITGKWPQGARIMIALSRACATGTQGQDLWGIETRIRRLEDMRASYVIELVPVSDTTEGLGSVADLEARWRSNFAQAVAEP